MSTIDLSELKARWEGELHDGALTLTPTNAGTETLAVFLQGVPARELAFQAPIFTLTPDATELTLAGALGGEHWPILGIDGPGLRADQARLTLSSTGAITAMRMHVDGTLTLADATITMRGELGDDQRLHFTPATNGLSLSLAGMADYMGSKQLSAYLPGGVSGLDIVPLSGLELAFGFGRTLATQVSFTSDIGSDWPIIGDWDALKGLGVTLGAWYGYLPGRGLQGRYGGNIHARLMLDQEYRVQVGLQGFDQWEAELVPRDGNLLPGLEYLAGKAGGATLAHDIQQGLDDIGLSDLAIEGVRVAFQLETKALRSIQIQGRVTLKDTSFLFQAGLPNFSLYGRLAPGDAINLKKLAADHLGGADIFPDDVALTGLWFAAEPGVGRYLLGARVEREWPLPLGELAFGFKEFSFEIERRPAGITGWAEGIAEVIGAEMEIGAQHLDVNGGWQFDARTVPGQEMHLQLLVNGVLEAFQLGKLDNMPDITLKNIIISVDTGANSYHFAGESTIPASVQLGNKVHQIDTALDLLIDTDPLTGKRRYSGFLRGDVWFGSAKFEVEYDFGAMNILKGSWNGADGALSFADLADSHDIDHMLVPPDGVDLGLKRAAFELNITESRFLLSAESARFGEAFFVARNANSSWDFVFGLMLKLSEIPGFPDLGELSIEQSSLLLSTVKDDQFQVPSLPALPLPPATLPGPVAPARRSFPVLGSTTLPLKPGVGIAALLDLQATAQDSLIASQLQRVVGKPKLLLQATLAAPISQSELIAYLSGALTITGSGASRIVLSNAFIKFTPAPFGAMIMGSVQIPIDPITLDASGALAINAEELQAVFHVQAEDGSGKPADLPFPFGLLGVRLSELGVAVGAIFEPPSVDLGVAGKFNVIDQPVGANEFAIMLELIEELPNPLYLSTYIQTISVSSLLTAVTGKTDLYLPAVIKTIQAEDLTVYWSERPGLVLPDSTLSQAGFGFNGMIVVGSFAAHAQLRISSADGVSGSAELAPIDWHNVLKVNGRGKGMSVLQAFTDGEWRTVHTPALKTAHQTSQQTRQFQIIPPGGATLAISSRHSPFVDLSVQMQLFNLISGDLDVIVTDSGFTFKLDAAIGEVAKFELHCTLDKQHFSGHAEFKLNLAGDIGPFDVLGVQIGPINLDVGADLTLDIEVDASKFNLHATGDFWFDDHHLTLPELTINVDIKSLEELPGRILALLADKARDVFHELFAEAERLLHAAEEEAKQIEQAISGEIAQIAADAEAEAARIEQAAQHLYDAIVTGLSDAEATAEKLEHEAAQFIAAAEAEAAEIAKAIAQEVADLRQKAAQFIADAEAEVAEIERVVSAEIAELEHQAEHLLNVAQAEAAHILEAIEQEANAILAEARRVGDAILAEAQTLLHQLEAELASILLDIEHALEAAAHWIAKEAEDLWSALKKY